MFPLLVKVLHIYSIVVFLFIQLYCHPIDNAPCKHFYFCTFSNTISPSKKLLFRSCDTCNSRARVALNLLSRLSRAHRATSLLRGLALLVKIQKGQNASCMQGILTSPLFPLLNRGSMRHLIRIISNPVLRKY